MLCEMIVNIELQGHSHHEKYTAKKLIYVYMHKKQI